MNNQNSSNLLERLCEKFKKSREFTISGILHVFLIFLLSTAVLVEVLEEPTDFTGGETLVSTEPVVPKAPKDEAIPNTGNESYALLTPGQDVSTASLQILQTQQQDALLKFEMPKNAPSDANILLGKSAPEMGLTKPSPIDRKAGPLSPGTLMEIKALVDSWRPPGSRNPGPGVGLREREFEFFAIVGRYAGGNWNSTIEVQDNVVTKGSMPNLLWIINQWSGDKIKTNEKQVRVLSLDSTELFSVMPPFIFLTGTRDFRLTDREVQNLQKYIRMGGCIWGDSSLPGRNSRFDIAFRREMRRVIPDLDKNFEALPLNHPLFTSTYFPEIKTQPPGMNHYQEPVYAMEIYGEIGILYTANDYGNLMQIGLDEAGQVDLGKNELHQFVAVNPMIWDNRFTYLSNVEPRGDGKKGRTNSAQNLEEVYKFGTNVVVHLLTRWDRLLASAPAL